MIYATIHARNHIEANALADTWNIFQEKNSFFLHNHVNSVGSVMFVERNSRNQETQAKKALNLVSSLSVTSQNFWGPGFGISTTGIENHPIVDWPCQNFTQGSTREQPNQPPPPDIHNPGHIPPILGCFGLFKTDSCLFPADASPYCHSLSVPANPTLWKFLRKQKNLTKSSYEGTAEILSHCIVNKQMAYACSYILCPHPECD